MVTHIKLDKDVKLPPLHVDFKENEALGNFFGFSNPELDRKGVFLNMLSLYDAWRTEYNAFHGYNKVEERKEKVGVVNVESQSQESLPEEVEESPREKTPDINDSNDFPSLGKYE